MVYGYLRVSTDVQDVEAQKIGITEKADFLGLKIEKWIEDEGVSGTVAFEKRNLGKLMKILKKGDVIIASEVSRFARKLFLLFEFLGFITKSEVELWTVKDNYHLDGSLQSTILAFAFGLSAQIERDMISQRTKEGLRKRKMDGVLIGTRIGCNDNKLKLDSKIEDVKRYIEIGLSVKDIAKLLKVGESTVYRFCDRRNIPIRNRRKIKNIDVLTKKTQEKWKNHYIEMGLHPELIIKTFKENEYTLKQTREALGLTHGKLEGAIKAFGIKDELIQIQEEVCRKHPSLSSMAKKMGLTHTREVRKYLRENNIPLNP